jgi:hydroxymethylbilane synthase
MKLRLGARGSALSLAQARLVAASLKGRAEVEIVTIATTGDRLSAAGSPIEWKGDFTRELDDALLDGRIALAVHSLKDVPSRIPDGIVLAAVPPREDPSDVLISREGRPFAALPPGARLGTSSPRRRAQLLAARPDLEVLEARGNVDTRLSRLAEGRFDAIVLARAGLARLGRLAEVSEVLPASLLLPAIGQGALAVFARGDDAGLLSLLVSLDDPASRREVEAERSLLATLEAGCRAPVAGLARVRGESLAISAAVFSSNGATALREESTGRARDAADLGRAAGQRLLERGAAALIGEGGA